MNRITLVYRPVRLLCRLGWHRWTIWSNSFVGQDNMLDPTVLVQARVCLACYCVVGRKAWPA